MIRQRRMRHQFLDAEVGHPQAEVHRRGHAHRRKISGAVAAGAHLVQRGKVCYAAQVGDAAGMHHGGTDVVDELLADQVLAVVDRVEHLAHRQRRGRVLANQAKRFLVFGRRGVFQPEQFVRLQLFAQTRGLDGREAVVRVVQQMHIGAHGIAHLAEQFWRVAQVQRRVPGLFGRQAFFGRLIKTRALAHAIGLGQARHARLHAHRLVALLDVALHGFNRFAVVAAVGMAVHHHAVPALATQQLINGHTGALAQQVPQRHVDGGDGRHGHRPAAPVRTAVQVLPDVFDLPGIAPQQAGEDMFFQVGHHGEFAAIQRGVTQAVQALVGADFHGDEIAARAGDDGLEGGDFQGRDPGRGRWQMRRRTVMIGGMAACRHRNIVRPT